jgi:hypothetical protein
VSLYLIPDDANCTSHFNASDLNAGTAKIGPAWTKVGTPAFNPLDGPVPSFGPFSDSNYFTLPAANPINSGTLPFTCVLLLKPNSLGSGYFPLSTGPSSSQNGLYLQVVTTNIIYGYTYKNPSFWAGTPTGTTPSGALSVLLFGVDASGNLFVQLNGGAPSETVNAQIAASSTLTYLGRDVLTGHSFGAGVIYEGLFSTDVPSAAAFAQLYEDIQANISGLTPTPENDVAAYLATASLGLQLTEGGTQGNLFTGAVLPASVDGREGAVPGLSVFVTSTGGPPPLPYMGPVANAGSMYFSNIQVNVRSAPKQQAAGIDLARAIRDTLHRATVPMAGGGSYLFCTVKESQPNYLGTDATGRHRWSINLDLRYSGLP